MVRVLVLNAGSSTLKFKLYNIESNEKDFTCIAKGSAEEISSNKPFYKISFERSQQTPLHGTIDNCHGHGNVFHFLIDVIVNKTDLLNHPDDIKGVGHRVVHGGSKYYQPTILTRQSVQELDELSDLAPLHNHPSVSVIKESVEKLKNAVQVAVFDTSYHQTIPEYAYRYALPYDASTKANIRRFGFHGTSHKYIYFFFIDIAFLFFSFLFLIILKKSGT